MSLSADGKTVAIGAPGNDDGNGYDAGHVRVYADIFKITSPSTAAVPENTPIATAAYTAAATGFSGTVTFSLKNATTANTADDDNDKFDITSSGVLTFKAVPDFENPGSVA